MPKCRENIAHCIGQEFLKNKSGLVFCVDIVSKFLTNCMDLLENSEIVKQLANAYVKPLFKPAEDYDAHISAYVIEMSRAVIGGLFSLESLSACDVSICIYYSLKIAINSKYKPIVDHALHAHRSQFCQLRASRISDVCSAMIFLQMHMLPFVHSPYAMTACSMTVPSNRNVI